MTASNRKKVSLKGKPSLTPERSLPGVEGIVVRSRAPLQPVVSGEEAEPAGFKIGEDIIPIFADELLAFLFIAVGLLSFLTLLNPASGALGSAWSGSLRQAFGIGAFIVSTAILATGALLLLPKLGVDIRINWWRVVAGELFLVFLLAYIHTETRAGLSLEMGREEAFASALEGRGGGLVGWAVQDVIYALFGDTITGLILLILLALCATAMFGIGRQQAQHGLLKLRNRLARFAWRMEGKPVPRPIIPRQIFSPPEMAQDTGGIATPSIPMPELSADGSMLVELPPIPGRPSIITGQTGAGALISRRAGSGTQRISPFRRPDGTLSDERREIKYRFQVQSQTDKKKIRKRKTDLPPLDLLDVIDYGHPTEDEINLSAQIIEETVDDFGMKVEVIGVKFGPTITQYAVQPFTEVEQGGKKVVQRVRVTRVASLAQDLSLALATSRVRIQAPVPGTNYIGIEIPNARPGIVSLRPILESEQFYKFGDAPLAIALGREVDGRPFAADLATMPHLLIGGTTGSGKSVCLTSITTCLVMNNRPDQLRLIMIDPKMVELVRFNGLPHLLGKVEVELDRIIGVLRWATREMDRRYRLMEDSQSRNIAVYNHGRRRKDRLPHIVILIDELAELMTEYPDETEHLLTRLAQMARATGIHLVVATQRPSTDVVTGLIKANFPARIAFAVASGVDSRVIIDSVGAEDLIGRGDMLYYASDAAGPIRLQGCFASDGEMERMVEFWRTKVGPRESEEAPWERSLTRAAMLDETDQMLEDAIRVIQREGEASASLLQRKLNVSYPRAGRIIDALYKIGAVGDPQAGGRTRRVLIGPNVDPTNYIVNWRNNH
ncbi:MAG: DNA translocase FtsK [Anaerolineae bacterium]|nr:DNA translocase FtsK [Anaerolineae bacterium]